jgi:hypothetical protein
VGGRGEGRKKKDAKFTGELGVVEDVISIERRIF